MSGTPSDYWLWDMGWVNTSNDHSGSGSLPIRRATPSQYQDFLNASLVPDSVLDLCQLTCSLESQIRGLRAHEAAGTAIRYVELGSASIPYPDP